MAALPLHSCRQASSSSLHRQQHISIAVLGDLRRAGKSFVLVVGPRPFVMDVCRVL